MPPQNTDSSVDSLGHAPLSSLDDSAFAAEFGLADPADVEAGPAVTAEETLDQLGIDTNDDADEDDDGDAGEDDEGADDEDAGDDDASPVADDDDGADDADADDLGDDEAAPSRGKLTEFMVEDADGDVVDVEGVEITFVANHETHTLPIDKVVRLAQMGKYNEALQQEVKASRTSVAEMEQRLEQLEELAEQRRDLAKRLLEDDDYLLAQRERYNEANSPEARAERAEQRLRAIAAEQKNATFIEERDAFVNEALYPAFEALTRQYPTVSPEELWGRFNIATVNITRNGIIPPNHWRTALQVVERDLGPFAAQLHDQRSEHTARAKSEETVAVRKAQEEATRAKRMIAKAIRPAGQGNTSAPKRRAVVSADDAVDDIIGGDVLELVRSMRG